MVCEPDCCLLLVRSLVHMLLGISDHNSGINVNTYILKSKSQSVQY